MISLFSYTLDRLNALMWSSLLYQLNHSLNKTASVLVKIIPEFTEFLCRKRSF